MSVNSRTGSVWYAQDWSRVRDVCKAINMGEGKLAQVTQEMVERYMNMVEEEIEGHLEPYYYVPLRPYNLVMPDGVTRSQFPGNIRKLSIYWTSALLLLSEFQQNEPNVQDAANNYLENAKKDLFSIIRYNVRIPGQRLKYRLKTVSPSMWPASPPEANF